MAVVDAEDFGPLRPRVVVGALLRRLWHQLEVDDRLAAVAHARANAVRARVAAANHNHVLALGRDERLVPAARDGAVLGHEQALLVFGQELHGEVHALELAPVHREVARDGGAEREHERVGVGAEYVDVDVNANVRLRHELDALLDQHVDSPLDLLLLQLHVGDTVHEQPTDTVLTLVHRHLVPHLIQLVGHRQARRPATDHRDGHARAEGRHARHHPTLLPRPVDDGVLHVFDRHRRVDEPGHASTLARRGADTARELRKVVCFVEAVDRLAPLPLVNQIVPLRDEVVDRAAGVCLAEGRAAVHAARRLHRTLNGVVAIVVQLAPVEHSL
mmetsp:Transcript_96794/g.276534  ORF Transcript_96794/g.276534 Transcript_96794/m.276534 type:complete len:331 (-) Transcript_96794:510-1502(-)